MSRVGRLWLCSSLYQRCVERLTQLGGKRRRAKSEFQLVVLQQWQDQKNLSKEGVEYFSSMADTLQWIQKKFDVAPAKKVNKNKAQPANDLQRTGM